MATKNSGSLPLRLSNLGSFVLACIINGLGSTGKLSPDGQGVGDVSNEYETRITPAGYAFSIWGVIYCLMAAFVVWQLLPQQRRHLEVIDDQIGWIFAVSNVVNSVWIIVWVQGTLASVWIAAILLFSLLALLLCIVVRAETWQKPRDSLTQLVVVDGTFSLYSGWVTVASILNMAVALKASGWRGNDDFTESDWSALMGSIAAIIYLVFIFRRRDGLYGLVFCWAAIAIISNNRGDRVIEVTYSVWTALVGLAALTTLAFFRKNTAAYDTIA
eukprot:CAMPEP_0182940222 /NCGR_PEP_ID=MMETSP0105_2-20130417/46943_1 /TAXON_ID=81532 ORGANISM="Acanthoeca-like sp., Strain 10tr" /NCGR_SAMPLE_ID=MMETSP0105_2 /ASSEMBLY_ACC=CAM_ASM_000205 /LENGTH=272 /DNA_ID=CAMNT_0025079691 /DNA_START=64 /DNA_END=879 /DNA_ORIENTATION=+